MERAIGEKFKVNGFVYVVVEDGSVGLEGSCAQCVLFGRSCGKYIDIFGECLCDCRRDEKSVHFEHFGVDFDPARHRHAV